MNNELNESLLCIGCNKMFNYATYLKHLESNICEVAHTNSNSNNYINDIEVQMNFLTPQRSNNL